jgi:predicted nucleic acid-binding protein
VASQPFVASCVIDASVLVKLFLPEAGSESATVLLESAGIERRRVVPDLAPVECANVLRTSVRRGILSAAVAQQSVADLRRLPVDVWPSDELLEPAFDLALSYNITVYDAVYIALAVAIDLPLITADEALVRKLSNLGERVRLLDPDPPDGQR